ncbi:MAG: PAS domain-containing protein, partial [Bacteroidota bacterium]
MATKRQDNGMLWKESIDSVNDPMLIISKENKLIEANKPAREFFALNENFHNKKCHQVLRGLKNPCNSCPKELNIPISSLIE